MIGGHLHATRAHSEFSLVLDPSVYEAAVTPKLPR